MAVIEKIKMQGFKSFAKSTEVPLGSDFSVILGPNGSGKSNLSDAICFVLGRLSAKSLRADKSANLIYNGGKKGEAAKEAEVSIFFDNSNKLFPLNVSKVKITRSVRENGQSKYKINDEIRTRQQVIDLLAAGKINPDGYNIVLQGDIVHVTEMPTEERRKVIEDISGIGVYEEKKEKAINELTKVDVKLNEASIVLKERETYLSELKKDRDHAAKYKDLESNIKRNKATFLHVQINDKQKKREEFESKINKNQEEADKIRKGVDELREEISKNKEEISSISKEIEEKGEKEQVNLHREIETVKEQKARDQARMEGLGNELNRINERKKQLEINLREITEKIKQLENERNNLTKKRKIIVEKESIIEKKLGGKRGDNREERELDEIEKRLDEKQFILDELNNKKTILLRDKDRLDTQINSLNKLSGGDELKKLKEFKEKFKEVSNNLNSSLKDNDNIVSQLSKARNKLREISEEQARLSIREVSFKEGAYGDLALNKIKELRMNGVYGTIAELGEVDKKFSMALEVAAGSRIKSIVVEDDSIAAKCIKYLKDNKLGVVTFLPLNKIKAPEAIDKKVGYGIALNLIKFDNKFSRAFGYVFGNTIVVENINQARNIGIGKDRMVTLDGDLVEGSGAMIGGFRRQKTGFKQMDFTKNLEELNNEIGRLREIVDSLEKKKLENEDNVYLLRNDKSELEGEIIKLEKSFGGEEEKNERESAVKNLNSVERELNNAEANYNKLLKDVEELKNKKSSLRESVSKIRGNKETDKIDSEFRQIREERIVLENELKNIEIQIRDGLIPERENIIRIIKEHEKEILEFQKESEDISDRLLKNLNLLKDKERNEKEFYSNFKNLFNKRNKLSDEIQKRELKSVSEYSRVRAIEDRTNSLNIDRAKVCAELEGLNAEYEQFKEIQLRKGIEMDKLKEEIRDFEKMMNNLGNVNLRALEIYDEIEKEYNSLQDKAATLKLEKEDVLKMISEIESKKGDMFMKSYSEISRNFERIFSELTDKGTAHLILDDKDNPFNGGLKIMVRIAKGKYLDIKSLSGGEKTLTALAFIFAIQEYDPGHFYVFDEVDAALDKTNSSKLAKLLRKYSDKAQYIVISHNDNLISEANQLYGVSMTENGMSKVISLKV